MVPGLFAQPGNETNLSSVFEEIVPQLKRRSLIVILSDCFDEMAPLMTAVS